MILWIVLILMLAVALVVVLSPQLRKRRRAASSRRDYDVAVYADQLRELKSDVERGVLSADQETQARLEIERRVLDADASQTILGKRTGSPLFSAIGASILLAFIPGFAVGIYLWQGSPDVPSQFAEIPPATAEIPPIAEAPGQAPEVGVAVEELVARLREQPDNLDGWLLLGRSYIVLGRHSEAVRAYREAAGLAPGDASVQSRLGESMVMAAEGFVTPSAREVFEVALGIEPRDPAARYYLALAAAQDGRLQAAFDGWRALASDGPADAPWLGDVRERLVGLAAELGLDPEEALAGLPAGPTPVQTAARGPTQEDMAAAAEMSPAERQAMIRGMVERLAARLEYNPNDPQGWARLAQSYEVLGEPGKAAEARARAETVSAVPASAPRGPSQDDIAAAAEMAPEDRQAMIRGMVERLAARLEQDPDDAQGWARLAQSYEVLGEPEKAAEARARGDTAASAPPPEPRGPSQEDIAAAAVMAPEDRMAMVSGMVEGLAARLADDPNDREGWLRLARSYEVLGEYGHALAALAGAARQFPDDVDILANYAHAVIEDAGPGAPVPQAAVELYRRVLEADGGNPDALFIAGLADAQAGRNEQTIAMWRRLLAVLDPATSAYAEVQRRIEALEGGTTQAR